MKHARMLALIKNLLCAIVLKGAAGNVCVAIIKTYFSVIQIINLHRHRLFFCSMVREKQKSFNHLEFVVSRYLSYHKTLVLVVISVPFYNSAKARFWKV